MTETSLDYTQQLLTSLQGVLKEWPTPQESLATLMGWEDVRLDWPKSPDLVKAWDAPVVFLKCEEKSSNVSAIGGREIYFTVELLLVYPMTLVGDHMEEEVDRLQRMDSDILEAYFYYFDQLDNLKERLEINFPDFYNLQQTMEVHSETKKLKNSTDESSARPALIFSATIVVEQTIIGFDYIAFLQKVMQLKG